MKSNNNSLYIVMPAYNEEQNIEKTIKEWYPVLKYANNKSKLIIADSGSTDNTHKILTNLKSKYKKLEIISDTKKEHGPKLIYLYKYAISNNIDYIFQTDSDGQTNPKEFKDFWKNRNNYDIILGNRTKRQDQKYRTFIEKVVCLLLKLYFNINVPDANAPFRLMKSNILKKYINKIPDTYNIPNIILTAYFVYNKESVLFKEISFKPRTKGKNSINIKKILKIGFKSLSDFKYFKKEMYYE